MKRIADFFIFLSIAINIIFALVVIFNPELIKTFISWIGENVQSWGKINFLIIFFTSFLESLPVIGGILPGQQIMLTVGGFYGKNSTENLIILGIVASIGTILSNYIGYFLGRKYGKQFFERYGIYFGIGETEIKYLESGVKKWGPIGLTLGKFHGAARSFLPFIVGASNLGKKTFFIYNFLASVIWATLIIILGVFFAENYELILDNIGKIFYIILIGGAIYIYFFKKKEFLKYIEEKNKEMEKKFGLK